jgi:lysyl-tRNA synthetase class 2
VLHDCAALLRLAAETAGATTFSWRGVEADPFAEPERLSVIRAW